MQALLGAALLASNPFSSSVIALNSSSFRALEKSPHVWMVNVCRQS